MNPSRQALCLFLIASGTAIACDTYFQSGAPVTLASVPGFSAVGDFNRDGKQDVALGLAQGGIKISGLSFTYLYPTAGPVTGITAADFNRDGLLDIAYASQGGVVGILLGNGDGSFRAGSDISLPFGLYAMAATDIDGDSVPDLVLGSITAPYLSSLIGDGAGGFRVGSSSTSGVEIRTLAVVPATPDSPPIIISGNFHQLFIYSAGASGALAPYSFHLSGGVVSSFSQMTTADVNGDGFPDLILAGDGVSVFYLPHGMLPGSAHFSTGFPTYGVAVGDVDGDGKLDLIASTPSQIKVLAGDGLGNFTPSPNNTSWANPGPVTAANFNGISRSDLIVSASNRVFLLENCYDVTPPSTIATASIPPNANGWNNTPVKINLDSTDNVEGVGVQTIAYSATGAVSTGGLRFVSGTTASIDIGVEGLTTITYQAADKNGNIEQPKSLTVRIDTTDPLISGLPIPGCAIWPPNEQLVEVANVASLDTRSGISSLVVTGAVNEPPDDNEVPDIVIAGGIVRVRARPPKHGNPIVYTVTAVATDNAGNSSTRSETCKVDH